MTDQSGALKDKVLYWSTDAEVISLVGFSFKCAILRHLLTRADKNILLDTLERTL